MPTVISGTTGVSQVQDGIITSNKIADSAITDVDINTSAAIVGSKLAANTITAAQLSANSIQRQNIGYSGGVLQVIQATKVDSFLSTSGSPTDIPGLSASITPTSTNSKILVTGTITVGGETWLGGVIFMNIVRNNNPIFLGTSGTSLNGTIMYQAWSNTAATTWGNTSPISFSYLDSPNSTAPQTYKIQGFQQASGYAWEINNWYYDAQFGATSSLTLMEIS